MFKRYCVVRMALVAVLIFGMVGVSSAGKVQNELTRESTLETIVRRGAVRVGFATFVPWAMKNKEGNFIGFEIDVMTRFAEDMGVAVEPINTKWAGIIPALLSGKFDVIIGSMGITPQRNLKVNFSIPYYYSGLELMANKELCQPFNPTSLEDFNRSDVIFAERMGVTAVHFIKNNLPKAQIREFDDMAAAYLEVINGRAHASLNDAPEPSFQVIDHPNELYMPLGSTKHTHEPIGFACRKGDPDWLNYLNNWITFQHSKPWFQERYHYWFETREWESLIQ